MSLSRITERYAKSLLDLATETNQVKEVLEDIRGFLKLTEQRDFMNLLKSPIIKKDKKRSIFNEVFEGKVNKMIMMFFNIVINKGRESILPEIATSFVNLYNESKNITEVELTTAVDVDAEIINKIQSQITSAISDGGVVKINTRTNENILGGFVLQYGDKLYDASLVHKISEMRKELLK